MYIMCVMFALCFELQGRCLRKYDYYYYNRASCFRKNFIACCGSCKKIISYYVRVKSYPKNDLNLRSMPDLLHFCLFLFFRAGLKDRMNLCLFCLSLVDGMFVFFYFLAGSHCLVRFIMPDLQTWWKWSVRRYVMGVYAAFLLCSGCLTMIISVERCVCVFLPLRATSLIRTRTMAVIVFTTIATIQGICVIYPLKVQTF